MSPVPREFPTSPDDVRSHNARAWDEEVRRGNRWTIPASPEEVAAARRGELALLLTPETPVPMDWYGELAGARVLCLASGGGQQAPLLAAAGADVLSYDNSELQLARDREVAEREGLEVATMRGDMADLDALEDGAFDLVFHPCSNCFVPDPRPVWREAFRVLRPGGALLSGFSNPLNYLFDEERFERGELVVRHTIPYSDHGALTEEERLILLAREEPLQFGHTLDAQIGGQLEAGFLLAGFFEDGYPGTALHGRIATYVATRAVKLRATSA